ncbi:claudin-11b [Kryptolebias marmoratus]|uniref:Claudin n=1 Tax=Kryptolebias marmoratus TaxID=37003 RepID=A0A3Q3BGD7_KRYMA|nr:claudin-11b [Kryptolebias marmoratus]XP_017294490.1 claudin-11b [Kryptolebias marmoratus]
MAHICRQLTGSAASCAGWVGLIVATATSDWVRTCDYSVTICVKTDELGSRGLWAKCVISPSLYHCVDLDQMFSLPAYIQTSRALMVCACLLGLPAMLLILMSMPCIRLPNDSSAVKKCRAKVGGVLVIVMAVCGIVSTIWFPIGAHQEDRLMSFGFSLYAGWVGAGLCVLGGFVILCCQVAGLGIPSRERSFFYSRRGNTATSLDRPSNHAISERV